MKKISLGLVSNVSSGVSTRRQNRTVSLWAVTICLLMTGLNLSAQTCQKIAVASLIKRMPQPWPNALEALKNRDNTDEHFRPYADEMRVLLAQIEQPNPVTMRKQKEAQAMSDKFKQDGVDQMTDEQKLAYAKQQNIGGMQGNIDFAQKMQDPAFRKKFEAMSPQEKMALMQQQGMMKTPAPPQQSSNPMQADMQVLLQDPAFRAKWQKMSPSEQQAYIENYKKSKVYDANKRPAPQGQSQGSLMDAFEEDTTKPNSPMSDATQQTRNLGNALKEMLSLVQNTVDQFDQSSEKNNADQQTALNESLKKQNAEGIAMAKKQGKSGVAWIFTNPKADHEIRLQFLNKNLTLANTTLASLSGEWSKRQTQLNILSTVYQAAMNKISFGETFYSDDKQLQNLSNLAGQQALIFASLKDIDELFHRATIMAAKAQDALEAENQVTVGPRELTMDGS